MNIAKLLKIILIALILNTSVEAQTTQYKDKYFANQVDCPGKRFKKVQSKDNNAIENTKIYCISNDKLVFESFHEYGKPIGTWKTIKTDGTILRKYDFDSLVYLDSAEKNPFIKDTTYFKAAIYPDGGLDGFFQEIVMKTRYPSEARDAGISGTIYIRAIVNETGKFTPHSIIRGANIYLDAEAWRVFSNVSDWEPATYEGKPTWTYVTMPLKFNLR